MPQFLNLYNRLKVMSTAKIVTRIKADNTSTTARTLAGTKILGLLKIRGIFKRLPKEGSLQTVTQRIGTVG